MPIKGARIQVKVTEVDEHRQAVEFNKIIGDYFMFRTEL